MDHEIARRTSRPEKEEGSGGADSKAGAFRSAVLDAPPQRVRPTECSRHEPRSARAVASRPPCAVRTTAHVSASMQIVRMRVVLVSHMLSSSVNASGLNARDGDRIASVRAHYQ